MHGETVKHNSVFPLFQLHKTLLVISFRFLGLVKFRKTSIKFLSDKNVEDFRVFLEHCLAPLLGPWKRPVQVRGPEG